MRYLVVRRQSLESIEADWLQQSTASGVFYANNFDFADRSALIASAAKINYGYVGAPSGATPEDPPPAAEKVGLDTTRKLTGRASLLLRYRNGLENLTDSGPAYSGSFGGLGVQVEGPPKTRFFMRWFQRHNAKWLATPHPTGTTTKHMVIFGAFTGFSSGQQGVCTDALDPRFPQAWIVRPSFERFANIWTTNPPGSGDHTYHTFVDLGPQGSGGLDDSNDLSWFQRRRGPVRREAGNWSAIADVANYPLMYRADQWFVHEALIDKTSDEVKHWGAPLWSPPMLYTGALAPAIPSADYTGFQCMLRPTDGTNVAFSGDDLEQLVDQIICSDNPIPFPGGYPLSYSSPGEAPVGYPFTGSSED